MSTDQSHGPAAQSAQVDERSLLQKALNQDYAAYAELIRLYHGKIYSLVYNMTSNREDAAKGLASVQGDMADGKGYTTLLKEIVEDIAPPAAEEAPAAEAKPAAKPAGRPAIKIGAPAIKVPAAPKAEDKPAPGKIRITLKK